MKKICLALTFCIFSLAGIAQNNADTLAPYQLYPGIPDFRLLQTDSIWFDKFDIPQTKYTAIIYFSPDCGHCQYEAEVITKNIDSLKEVFFIWASYRDMEEISAFKEQYKISQFPNMRIGRDPSYFIPAFYRAQFTPLVVLYNKKNGLVKRWDKGVEIPE